MNRNNIYTVNPLYNGSTTQTTEDGSVQSGGTTIIYQQGGGTGLTDAQKQKLDGIQEGAEVNQNAYSKVRLNGSDALIIEAKNKTDILNMSGVYPIAIAINGNGGLDFTVSSDQSNTNSVVTQSQLKAAIDQLEKDKYWKVDADGKLYTELDVYSHKEISAYGAGTGGGSTGGAGALYECADVLRDGDKVKGAEVGSILSYNGSHWYAIPQSAITPDLTNYATKSYVTQQINDLIGGAPGTLDTLKEIAEALGNNPNFATTVTEMINNIGLRVDQVEDRVVSLEDMFEWDKSASASDPSLWRIKAKKDLYGVGEISAYGYSSGTVPIGAQYMYELKDVLFTELTSGQLLQWNGTKWINIDKNAVGLNETELAKYLTNNNYAKKSDITWANLLNKPTTWGWASITGKPTTLAGYGITDGVPNTRRVSAGSGLAGGGVLSSDVTISLGTIGTAGTYTKITTDMYGRVVSGTTLSESDIPTLQISKISGLQSALNSKLNISDFNTWFTIKKDSQGRIVSIQANYDFFSVGEISAYGLGETQPSVTTLAGLDDVTITSPANGQTLIYDSATSQWKNGTIIGGGNISLNGTVYKPVNGTITLPNLVDIAGDQVITGTKTFKAAGNLKFGTSTNGITLAVDSGKLAVANYANSTHAGIQASFFKKVSGTSSQFLKADGSVDGNLYALAYEGNQNKVQYSRHTDYLKTADRRNQVYTPNIIENSSLSSYFTIQDTPYANWRSTISVKGWSSDYATWELTGPSHNNDTIKNERPYFRYGFNTNWEPWRAIAFLDDVKNVADIYFNGQNIYSDYGHWVVGLIRIGTADIGDKYISGEMIYRRSNGIYANGSVRFNLIKKYQTTSMFAGVLYVGYGINTDQDAPRLCTFTYQGVKWGGLCWRSAASLNSIKTIIYDNSSTDTPFYVRYYNSQSGEVQNTEINNSISVLGSDIDIFPISSNGKFYTSSGRMDIHSAGNDWAYMRYTTDGRFYDIGLSSSRNSGSAMNGETGNFEIRPNGSSSNGIFVRYSNSSYGRLGVVSRSTQECSISYWNNAPTSNYPLWTVGAGIRNQYSFDWYYHNQGYKATLDGEGKLFVNVRVAGNPYCSLTIGDYDTGLHWQADGIIEFRSNAKQVGYWGYTNGRLYNTYFREPTGNGYAATSMMVNGNGSNLYPGIGFHQPGVTAGVVYFTNSGEFKFRNIKDTGYTNVYGGNLIADAGFLYSRYNGIEIKIGAENGSYVHFITNPARSLYFANSLFISGGVLPYTTTTYDLGDAGHIWRNIYANKLLGGANWADYLSTNYIGGKQPNPQTYFGSGTGLKVAMTGVYTNGAYWSDTLWVNGYYGDNVPKCTALHFPRDGSAEMYISSQETKSTNYGAVYRIWSSRNSNKSDVDWVCKGLSAHARIGTTADIYSAGWIRAGGTNGFYCESYGGGWHMTDSTWIRAYNNKQIYTASTSPDAIHTLGGINASGRIYSGSYVELHGGLVCAGVGNSGGASGFNVYGSFYGNASHGGIEIGASDNVLGIGVHSNDSWYIWWTNSGSIGSSSNKSYIFSYNGSSWNFTGSVVASGEVTAYSDARLKSNIHTLDYRGRLIPRHYVKDGKQSIGFIAQEVQSLYPELVLGQDKNRPYLSLNYNGCTAVLSAQLNHVEDEVTMLKNKVRELEIKVSVLTEQLHSQAI